MNVRDYVGAGWKVFPCLPHSKQPAVKWTQFVNEDYTEEKIIALEAYLDRGYNLAVALKPSGLVAFDLDNYRGEAKLPQDILQTNVIQSTPRGGKHYVYSPNGNGDNLYDAKLTDYNIDVKYNGYILVTPSAVEYDTNEGGKWIGKYSWDNWDKTVPHLPESAMRFFNKQHINPETISTNVLTGLSADMFTQTATDPIDTLISVIQRGKFDDGQHNNQLHELSRALYRVMLSDNAELKADLTARLMLTLDAKDPTPQGAYQALETIKSGIEYEHTRLAPKIAQIKSQAGLHGDQIPSSKKLSLKPKQFGVVKYSTFAYDYENYEVDYLIDGVIPRQGIIMLVAPPEMYKTWVGFDVVTSIATNKHFLGAYATNLNPKRRFGNYGEPVLIVQQEDFEGLQAQRLHTMLTAKWGAENYRVERVGELTYVIDTPALAPIFIHTERGLSLENENSVLGLYNVIKEHRISYTYVDPFYSLMNSTESYFSDAGNKFQLLRDVRIATDSGFLIAHHAKKVQDGKRGRDNLWGSQFLAGAIEGVIVLSANEGKIDFEVTGKFYAKPVRQRISFDIVTDPDITKCKYDVTVEEQTQVTGNKATVLEFLLKTKEPMRTKDIADELEINKGTISKALKDLTDEGLVTKVGSSYMATENMGLNF